MDFYTVFDQVLDLLRQRGRVSYRALKLQFHLDDEHLEAIKEEIIEVQQLAVDQDGRMLVWTGAAPATSERVPPALRPVGRSNVSYMYRSERAKERGNRFACDSLCSVLV